MRWTERQRAMLREMGIHLWAPDATPATTDVAVVAAPPAEAGTRAGAAVAPVARARVETPSSPRPAATDSGATATLPGLAPADWLVVADPLDDGDPQQRQLLDNMLRAIGVALVAPDRERRAVFCAIAAGPASATTRASDQTLLQAATATVAPRCILAFGRAGAATLLGDDTPIGSLRGRVHTHAGAPVVVTFSLPFLLRHPAEKAKAWADLCLAVGSLAATLSA